MAVEPPWISDFGSTSTGKNIFLAGELEISPKEDIL